MGKNRIDKTAYELFIKPKLDNVVSVIKKRLLVIFVMLVFISTSASLLAFHFWRQSNRLAISDSSVENQEEVKSLVAEISKFMVLPDDEEPTVATVSDPSKLKDQNFFSKAKKGYKVLIYTKAQKAILYDPINNKLINVTSIDIGDNQETPTPNDTPASNDIGDN